VVTPRRGASRLGCLFSLAAVAALLYLGGQLGQIYWRYYRYQDALREQVRFGDQTRDEDILRQLGQVADTLELPADARDVHITRGPHSIRISGHYVEHWQVPYYSRDFEFWPSAENHF
jgi:hypothetical protein